MIISVRPFLYNKFLIIQNTPRDAHLAEKKLIASKYRSGAKESQATLYSVF